MAAVASHGHQGGTYHLHIWNQGEGKERGWEDVWMCGVELCTDGQTEYDRQTDNNARNHV